MTTILDIYGTIRLVKERLQELQHITEGSPESHERDILAKLLDVLVVFAREAETLAHHVRQVQERQADIAATLALLSDELFGPPRGAA